MELDFISIFNKKLEEKNIDYNGSVVKTKIKDFYNEPICMVVGG